MYKVLRDTFVMLRSTIILAIIYGILDFLCSALVCITACIRWGDKYAVTDLFRAVYVMLFVLEIIPTIPIIIYHSLKEETNGTESSI